MAISKLTKRMNASAKKINMLNCKINMIKFHFSDWSLLKHEINALKNSVVIGFL